MEKKTVKDTATNDYRAPRGERFSTATHPQSLPAPDAKADEKGGWYSGDLQD